MYAIPFHTYQTALHTALKATEQLHWSWWWSARSTCHLLTPAHLAQEPPAS